MSEGGSIFGGRKSMFGKEGSEEVLVDLNLTPLMDVMANILFFLLASFGAAIISFLAASVPVQADDPSEPTETRTDTVTVNLQINPDGYKLSCSNDKVAPEKLEKLKASIPRGAGGKYDTAALGEALVRIKTDFPASETVMIVPNDKTTYEDIVLTMEVSKEVKREDKRLRLFPKAVIADLVRAE